MKIAIASSLQGWPEETSPDTPLDTTRLARYVAENLQRQFPQVEVGLYDREKFPGQGDAYLELRDAICRWGADAAVHIHQDAGAPGARGWHILYYHDEALPLATRLVAAMSSIPSPARLGGLQRRSDVAVLKRPPASVLVEAGFYTSPEDEALGVQGWGDPIVRGIANYLIQHCHVAEKEGEEEEDMVDLEWQSAPETGQGMFEGKAVDVYTAYGRGSDWLHVRINRAEKRPFLAFFNRNSDGAGFGPVALESNGYAGFVAPIAAAFNKPGLRESDYGWVAVHVLPEDSKAFRGFVRA